MDEIRATLAQLMGKLEEKKDDDEKSFLDSDVCRMFLTGVCPHDLFENTKHYMGECSRIHSEKLREQYMNERKNHYYGFESDTLRVIQPLIDECDRRIARGKARAEDDIVDKKPTLDSALLEETKKIDEEIQKKMSLADELGMNGEIEESFKIVEEVELLKKNKLELLEKAGEASYQQRLKPCDICGALLSATDSDRRLTEHYSGKIHLGFQKLRDMAKALKIYINENKHLRSSLPPREERSYKESDSYEGVTNGHRYKTSKYRNNHSRSGSDRRREYNSDNSGGRRDYRRRSRSRDRDRYSRS